jgi:hypothetical protein
LAETRNYVQRVMENLQVYRARFGGILATVEPNLHRADPSGFEPRPSSSNKRRFHIEVDHDSQGVLPRAITIQMPKPPQAGHQIPSLQLRRDHTTTAGIE